MILLNKKKKPGNLFYLTLFFVSTSFIHFFFPFWKFLMLKRLHQNPLEPIHVIIVMCMFDLNNINFLENELKDTLNREIKKRQ